MKIDVETMDKISWWVPPRTDDSTTEFDNHKIHILITLLGIELRLLLLPRRLALIELDAAPSRSRSNAFCADASNDAYKLSAKSGKWRRNSQKFLQINRETIRT